MGFTRAAVLVTMMSMRGANAFRLARLPRAAPLRCTTARGAASGGSYYEVIGGLKHDREAMDAARKAVEGRGDGRVSVADANDILSKLLDGSVTQSASGNAITEVEYRTAFRVLADFKFTDEARAHFIEKLAGA
jgi:hypothetical protein